MGRREYITLRDPLKIKPSKHLSILIKIIVFFGNLENLKSVKVKGLKVTIVIKRDDCGVQVGSVFWFGRSQS